MLIAHDGYILNTSDDIFSNIEIDKKDIIKNNIGEILKDFNFEEIRNNLISSKTPLTIKGLNIVLNKKKDKINLTFYPIFDSENNLTFIIASKREKVIIIKDKEDVVLKPEDTSIKKKFKVSDLLKNIGKKIQKINIFKE